EGTALKGRLTHISGYRYKTSKYLLGTLDTKGEYYPSFSDFQTFINYDISSTISASLLGSYATNKYEFFPENRETSFGLLSNPLAFKVYYDGWEHNTYQTGLTAATITFRPAESLALKFIASSYISSERETYDILGEYWINELDNSLGSSTYSDSLVNVGIGSFLNHARNSLDAYVYSFHHKGTYVKGNSTLQWGVKVQRERVFDNVKEWELIDSAGYSLPNGGNSLNLYSLASAHNRFDAYRHSGYIQEKYEFNAGKAELSVTAGVRATYSMLNGELNISPRFSLEYTPHEGSPVSFHLSGGSYVQPPFVKELQDETGKMNFNLKAQKSIQIVAGSRYDFSAFGKPFRFTSEVFYKRMRNLEPYKMDNIQVTYSGMNVANGYAYGADFKVNGELLPDAESWVSLSFLSSREHVDSYVASDGTLVHAGYFPTPNDQRLNLSMFFQDYLAGNPTVRVHLTLQYGTGLPFFSPEKDRWDNYFRMPPYRRVDIGFTKVLIDNPTRKKVNNFAGLFRSLMVTVEVFNLLDINNTVSYLWVRTVGNQEGIPNMLAIPNYLTSRRFNLKLSAKF
ncbi:MAG TPA: TonB-dependent receptor, partial [Williamwhitmania sp.]|nr:TonB-dependent receptor [Williamwhitmania sp.]